MMNINSSYILIHESNRSRVYLLSESDYNQPVVVKVLKDDSPISPEANRLENEYEFTKDIEINGVRNALDFIEVEKKPALVMAYFSGKTLKQAIGEKPTLIDSLEIAARIARIINDVHNQKIIHRSISSENILIDPETKQVKLIDFGYASRVNIQMEYSGNLEVLPGDLHYISPEQTGRMNRIVDYRSDLYSFGVVLYEMLTGTLPFESDDPLALVHAHIAKSPKPIKLIDPTIPPLISDIVAKLLAKNAEDRYQSAFGLYNDLERCLTSLQGSGGRAALENLSFELGQNDLLEVFRLPQKLYGRSLEISALLDAFERVAAGSNELFIIAGDPGIGKSSLAAELYKPITAKRGYFVRGKFDQFRFNSPYSAFIQALNQFVASLLNEPEAVLQIFQKNIAAALGANGAVLTELIPRLEDIIGRQVPAPPLTGRESRFRLNRAFQKLMGAISTAEHPLVFFIDDWQWADTASFELLKTMFSSEVGGHLLVIMAYRDNEVSHAHPLMLALSEVEKEGIKPNVITLKLLEEPDINMLIADTLKCSRQAAWPLTRLVYRITRGNPFFINQFLHVFHAEDLITFDHQSGSWTYDITRMERLELTDDVVRFIAMQLEKLPETIRNVLKLAACIGSRFELEMLAAVCRKSVDDTTDLLQEMLQEGLLIPPEEGDKTRTYRFIHDRVQQAAYSLISEKERQRAHLAIGRLMLENSAEETRNEKIFEIINQLNRAIELHVDSDSRIELARLNFIAGQRAKSAAAFASAWSYLKTGLELLPEDCWQNLYEFTLDLYKSSVEASFFSGDSKAAHDLIEIVNKEAKTLLDTVRVNEIKIQILGAEKKFEEAIHTGLDLLKLMGQDFPETVTQEEVAAALKASQISYCEKNIQAFIGLPLMSDPLQIAATRIMESLSGAAYLSSPYLYTLLILKRMNLIMTHGNLPTAALCYASFGSVLCGRVGDIETGVQFGQLALDLLQRMNARELSCRVNLLSHGFIFHWKRPVRDMLIPMRTAFYNGLETGDLEYSGYSAILYSNYALYAGADKALSELQPEIAAFSASLLQLKIMTIYHYLQITLQALHDLREGRSDSEILQGEYYDEASMLPHHLKAKDQNGLFYLYSYKLLLSYLFGDYKQALEDAEQAQNYLASVTGLANVPVFYLFDSLTRIAAFLKSTADDLNQLLSRVDANQEKLKNWARHAPMNCLHKYDLVEAVRHQMLGEKGNAIDYFDRAIAGAKENGYLREEALANELAAKFYLDWGKEKLAQDHMQAAHYGYLCWGAVAKATQLRRNYPELLVSASALRNTQSNSVGKRGRASRADGVVGDALDLLTVIKASQALAGEIKLERLLRQMLLIMFENAGAQRGALILKDAGEWVIQAQGKVGSEINVLQTIKLRECPTVAAGIVHETARTGTSIVLDNASSMGDFVHDPYISRNQIKSVMCMPLVNQGELSGILYLENNLAAYAFTAKRLELLNLLSAQMALSLDNARLYEQSQTEIAERKVAEASLRESQQKFRTIFDSVNDAIFVFELSTGNLLDVNNTMCAMYGYTREEALKLKTGDLSSGEYPYTEETARELTKKTTTEKVLILEWMARGKGGRLFWVEANSRRALIGGKIRLIVTARDITARKQAEAEIKMLNQELEQRVIERTRQLETANEELRVAQDELVKREKLTVLGQLTATVSHELRNPLGVIRSSNFYLQRKLKGQDLKTDKHFGRIEEQISQCNSIIEDLLEFTQSRSISTSKASLGPLMEQVAAHFKETTEGIEIKLHLAEDLAPITHDRKKMSRVMINLLTNAVQAVNAKADETAQSGRSYQPEISIAVSRTETSQVIVVADNGGGMSEETCRRAFEPLFTTRARGTGIGLSNVKKIIEEHDGSIALESKMNQGTRITLTLPVRS